MKLNKLKKELLSSIDDVCSNPADIVLNPERDFTRNRKLPLHEVIRCIVAMGGSSLSQELLDINGYSSDTATSSAFIQQRAKLKPAALKKVLHCFNARCNKYRKKEDLRILAVDGSDVQIPTNPDDPETFISGHNKKASYNLLHLNAMYDLKNRTYTDVVFGRQENSAFISLVDSSTIPRALVIVDRGYESYNNMAHVQEKGWYFLIRIRDGLSNGIKSGLDIPSDDEFDVDIDLKLTRKHTKELKQKFKDRNRYKRIPQSSPFDFLPSKCKKSDPDTFYPLRFRIVRVKINNELFETLLTNLPKGKYPPCKLTEFYNQRWGIETSFRSLKYTTGLLYFHSKKVACIKLEIYAKIIMYNFTEMITSHVITRTKKKEYIHQANFTIATRMCRMFFQNKASPPKVEAVIARETVPIRPERKYPRSIKRKRTYICFTYRVA